MSYHQGQQAMGRMDVRDFTTVLSKPVFRIHVFCGVFQIFLAVAHVDLSP